MVSRAVDAQSRFLVTVVIPVYNVGELLIEAIESVEHQTLNKEFIEVIVVDDASTDPPTLELLDEIGQGRLAGLSTAVVRHDENRGLAQARNSGVDRARGRYVCCLDGDDLIHPDYLKKSALLLEASPADAGWVYPSVRKFGHVNKLDHAEHFQAHRLFVSNYCVAASVFRKAMWESVGGQRLREVLPGLFWFEDWDFWIRGMARGWYGIPLREPLFLYRQQVKSMITRDQLALKLNKYLVQWYNARRLLSIRRAQQNYLGDLKAGRAGSPARLGLRDLPDRIAGKAVRTLRQSRATLFPWSLLLLAALAPRRFTKLALTRRTLSTRAEVLSGFDSKLRWNPAVSALVSAGTGGRRTIFFAHNWWRTGGAQRVLLDWMRAARSIEDVRIIEVVERTGGAMRSTEQARRALSGGAGQMENARMRTEFAEAANEQHPLDCLTVNPLTALRYCWELLLLERPGVLFIMSNPFFYVLAPFVKRHLPRTTIVDLLHCEEHDLPAWFGVSDEYKAYLDVRIVISEYWRHVLVERYGEDPKKIRVAMNGVDLMRFDPMRYDREELRHHLGIESRTVVVAFIGRLEPQKSPETFVELARLMREDSGYKFIVVGGGSLEVTMRASVRSLDNLRLFGEVRDTAPFYALADVVVCPSVYEGYPLVGLEAAAMNCPVIATDIPGFREQLLNGGCGIVYPQCSPAQDAMAIRDILYRDRLSLVGLGRRGRDFVQRSHDLDRLRGVYCGIVRELLLPDLSGKNDNAGSE